jgi:transcription antitermination factor NusG
MGDSWYALHIKSRYERLAQIHLDHKGYKVLLPTYVAVRRWSDRTKSLSFPLFPNYLFCRFDAACRLPVLMAPGVNFIVGAGRTPVPVNEKEITAIKRALDSGLALQACPCVTEGEQVHVISGPLNGIEGVVLRGKSSHRLILSISLLSRAVTLEIDQACLAPIQKAEPRSA